MQLYDWGYEPDDLEVQITELLVATADGSDALIDHNVTAVLQLLRQHLKMDVVFISEFVDGQRVFRRVESRTDRKYIEEGQGDALEQSFCQRVVDGRLPSLVHDVPSLPNFGELPVTPFRVGAHLSTPIVLNDGRIYGTLCCFSEAANPSLARQDLRKLELSAKLTAQKIDEQRAQEAEAAMAHWNLQPKDDEKRR
ncbi:MAG: GAF domain-containing protein [Comamonadaceae bacterium]|nr:MAG: GAF domain-containing protein [Comamonadaceae bacterium]